MKNNKIKKQLIRERIAIHKSAIQKLRHAKLKPRNIKYLDSYYVFDMGDSAICHFQSAKTPGWLYGIWINKDQSISLIGEHLELVDKFKPSSAYISTSDIEEFILQLRDIASNDKVYFIDNLTNGEAQFPWVEKQFEDGERYCYGYQCKREFNEDTGKWDKYLLDESITQESFVEQEYLKWQNDRLEKLAKDKVAREYIYDFFYKIKEEFEYIQAVGIVDKNLSHKGRRHTPRFEVICLVPEEYLTVRCLEEVDDFMRKGSRNPVLDYTEYSFDLEFLTTEIKDLTDACHQIF